ncbi:hypothetical protein Tco_1508499 [Tanacetum coccineum]
MHNNIMAAGSKYRPPMVGPGRYSQWRSRFLRYIDTKNNGEGLKKCILNGPYVPTSVLIQAVPAAEGRPAVQQHTAIETVLNMTPENKEHFQSEKEAIFLLLTGIGDEIYSTVDACNTANEMWIAIKRLQQGESLNVQDFDKEQLASYINASECCNFLQQLNQNVKILTYQATKTSKIKIRNIIFHKNKVAFYQTQRQRRVAKTITPQSESVSEEDSDPEQAQRDKEMAKEIDSLVKGTVGIQVCNRLGYSALNCKGIIGTMQSEWQEAKAGKDYAVSQGKDVMSKQAEHKELEAHYSYMAKIQEVSPKNHSSYCQPLENSTNHDESHVYDNVVTPSRSEYAANVEYPKRERYIIGQ